jgi:hypothetical protein
VSVVISVEDDSTSKMRCHLNLSDPSMSKVRTLVECTAPSMSKRRAHRFEAGGPSM